MAELKFILSAWLGRFILFLFPQRTSGFEHVYIVSGSPRSGTTLFAETLANLLEDPLIVWEPLQDKMLRVKGLTVRRPVLSDLQQEKALERYILGLMDLKYLEYFNTWMSNLKYLRALLRKRHKNIVIKFTRGNGIADVFTNRHQVKKVFLVIRNPYSVIASQIEHHEFSFHPIVSEGSPYHSLVVSFLKVHPDPSLSQRLALTWVVDYLHAKSSSGAVIVNYSIFLQNPSFFLGSLWAGPHEISLGKSSTFNEKTRGHGGFEVKWRRTLSEKMVKEINSVISFFRVESLILEDFDIAV